MIQRENFPADLLVFRNWCVWDLRDVNGRITKLPYNPRTLRLALVSVRRVPRRYCPSSL